MIHVPGRSASQFSHECKPATIRGRTIDIYTYIMYMGENLKKEKKKACNY